ncbi:MAG: CBS domain-containing protein [Rhodospirillaceae bacterium]
MKIRDVMHKGVVAVDPGTSIRDLAATMRDEDIGAIPVIENDRLVGMVTDRDLVCRGLADGHDIEALTARDIMTVPGLFCTETGDVEDAVHLMNGQKVRRLPVVDSEERVIGMLTLGDISAGASRDLSGEAIKAVSAHHV